MSKLVPVASIPPFGLRLQRPLKSKLEAAAKAANRSLNAEITARLEASFQAGVLPDGVPDFVTPRVLEAVDKIEAMEARLTALEKRVPRAK